MQERHHLSPCRRHHLKSSRDDAHRLQRRSRYPGSRHQSHSRRAPWQLKPDARPLRRRRSDWQRDLGGRELWTLLLMDFGLRSWVFVSRGEPSLATITKKERQRPKPQDLRPFSQINNLVLVGSDIYRVVDPLDNVAPVSRQ